MADDSAHLHIPTHLNEIRRSLEHHLSPITDSPQVEAWQLLEALLTKPKHIILNEIASLTAAQRETLRRWLTRRLNREPLQYITQTAYFYGLKLKVTPAVLIPRPETEVMVADTLHHLHKLDTPSVVDVGTGSGAITLAIKHEQPQTHVTASDISEAALELARSNATSLGCDISFIQSDLLTKAELQQAVVQADVVLANLPYLPKDDQQWLSPEVLAEPSTALFAGEDGLELAIRLEQHTFQLMQPDSLLYLELDPRNVSRAFEQSQPWTNKEVLSDLVGRQRFLKLTR
ncbi:MAG: peptide chain release factor N(5)-glutamine methyltransferase [Deinococcota bacterium]